jgi:hypothetical protein
MGSLNRMLSAAVLVGVAGTVTPTSVRAQPSNAFGQSARVQKGSIAGTVSDDRGGPVAGAIVSAVGVTMATAISDSRGYFMIDALPPGEYFLQAHSSGFSGSARERVRVVDTAVPAVHRLHLRRVDLAAASSRPVPARPIMAAGFGLPATTLSDQADGEKPDDAAGDHPHNETAWRLRHIKRSILKDASPVVAFAGDDSDLSSGSMFGRAIDSAASLAATVFTELPFSGEVNLLTTGAFAPGDLFSGHTLPRGVAYLSIGAPTPAGDWSARAAMSQGDLSSWIIAGAFASRRGSTHSYNFGLSYATQEYVGGNPAALAAVTDGSRNVGEVYAFDQWSIARRVTFEYGGRYARHDYLEDRGLLSPRVALAIEPLHDTRVVTTVAQRMVAPGTEEFLATGTPGPWLPPERTFAPLADPRDITGFHVERARYVDIAVEHEVGRQYVVGVRRFFQSVDNQLVNLFGVDPISPESVGHYYVANAGAFGADGWGVRFSSPPTGRVRGSIDYSITHARWGQRGDVVDIERLAPAAVRPETEDFHEVTTRLESDIPESATHVFLLCRMNTAFTRANSDLARPGLDARFDVQVNQALPFAVGGTRWEVLVGVRNLFRAATEPGSVYDELLVVRPPKRVVGGFLVKF